jgi:hypothetical protein
MCTLLARLTAYNVADQYEGSPSLASPATDAVPSAEAWMSPSYSDLDQSVPPPHWQLPGEDQVCNLLCELNLQGLQGMQEVFTCGPSPLSSPQPTVLENLLGLCAAQWSGLHASCSAGQAGYQNYCAGLSVAS